MVRAIALLELELKRLRRLVIDLHESGRFDREKYRAREVRRFERILDLLVKEEAGVSNGSEY
jgi:hypothetical protein